MGARSCLCLATKREGEVVRGVVGGWIHLGDLDSHGGQGGGVLQNDGGVVVYGIHHLISRPARQLRLAVIHLPQAQSDFRFPPFLPRGKMRPGDKLQIKAATILPLVGLAKSKTRSDVGAVLSIFTAPRQPGGHSKHPLNRQWLHFASKSQCLWDSQSGFHTFTGVSKLSKSKRCSRDQMEAFRQK